MDQKMIKLKNGISAYLASTPEFKSVYMIVSAAGGSAYEDLKNNGITHFMEHTLFLGTEKFKDDDEIDSLVEQLGGSYNASTGHSKIDLYAQVPDTAYDIVIDLLHQLSFKPTFPDEKLERERKVILDEFHRAEADRKYAKFYVKHRYVKGMSALRVIGKKKNIKAFKIKDLKQWHDKIFDPQNTVIVIVGNLDLEKAAKKLTDTFGTEPVKETSLTLGDMKKVVYSQRTFQVQVDKSEDQAIGSISFPTFSRVESNYKERLTLSMVCNILANYSDSILYVKLRKESGLLYSVSCSSNVGAVDEGDSEIYFYTSDDRIVDAYKIVFEEFTKFCKNGVTQKELDSAKEKANNYLKMGYSSINDITNWVLPFVRWGEKIMTPDEVIEIRNSITLEDANAMIKRIFEPSRMVVLSRVKYKKTKILLEKIIRPIYESI